MEWLEELKKEFTVQDSDYSEYLRLELRKRALLKEIKSIQHQQTYVANKIKTIWARDKKKNHQFGKATFFLKNNLVLNKNLAVEDEEVVRALQESGFDDCVNNCVNWKALRDLVRKTEGKIPAELAGLLTLWCKSDLYIRLKKENNNE